MPSTSPTAGIYRPRHSSRATRRLRRRQARQRVRWSHHEEIEPSRAPRAPRGTRRAAQEASPAADGAPVSSDWDGDASAPASAPAPGQPILEHNPPQLAFEDGFWGRADDLDDCGLHDFVYGQG